MIFLNWLRKLLLKIGSIDAYDIRAFYVVDVFIQEFYFDQYIVVAVMADSTPSSGLSRFYDRNYDYHSIVEYTGDVVFDLEKAEKVKKLVMQRRKDAHESY